MIDRRNALKLVLGSAAALAAPSVLGQTPAKPRTRLVFLGTKGGPRVGIGASNPANSWSSTTCRSWSIAVWA